MLSFDFGELFGPGQNPIIAPDINCYIKKVQLNLISDSEGAQIAEDFILFPSNDVVAGNCYGRVDTSTRLRNANCFEGSINLTLPRISEFQLEYFVDDG